VQGALWHTANGSEYVARIVANAACNERLSTGRHDTLASTP